MPQIINTNISSLNAQRNLNQSGGALQVSLSRLSSGLRINSAKDDAAGLSIATRFTSQIRGLGQAARNANDAISLAQVSEGALQEYTSILQRARELSIQSANGSNSASDRNALQAEVNQLKSELTRIATTTTFNNVNVLTGDLSNAEFQVGAFANQTVTVSVSDTRTNAIGTNQVLSSGTNGNGIEAATHFDALVGGSLGSNVGDDCNAANATLTNGYEAQEFTLVETTTAGVTLTTSLGSVSNNDSAATIAATIDAATGLQALGFNHIRFSAASNSATTGAFSFSAGTDEVDLSTITDLAGIATAINADSSLQTAGVYAVSSGGNVDVYSVTGLDFVFESAGTTVSITTQGMLGSDAAAAITGTASACYGGRVDIYAQQGYNVRSNVADNVFRAAADANILDGSLSNTTVSQVGRNTAFSDTTNNIDGGNNILAQSITLAGPSGTTDVALTAGQTAESIVTAVNAVSGATGITAEAQTVARMQNLSADGTVSFTLHGDTAAEGGGTSISATVTTDDLTPLVTAINDASGATGITAAVGTSNSIINLTHPTGKDIKIVNFTHSAAVDYQDPDTLAVSGDGSTVAAVNSESIDVIGNPDTEDSTNTVSLYDGGEFGRIDVRGASNEDHTFDSTVIGGSLTFNSSAAFNITSNIDGAGATAGSLFSVAQNNANASTLTTLASIDISTAAGAQSAITVIDQSLTVISEIRADLGAVQARFESAIRNLENNIENLSAARSRILDADFAAETSALTKNQILQQAGISVLSQANSLPQNALALLQ